VIFNEKVNLKRNCTQASKGNVQISHDDFLQFYTPPPYNDILMFSASPLTPSYDVFYQPLPTYTENRGRGMNGKLSFFSHYKSYMTRWPNPLPQYDGTLDGLSTHPPPKVSCNI